MALRDGYVPLLLAAGLLLVTACGGSDATAETPGAPTPGASLVPSAVGPIESVQPSPVAVGQCEEPATEIAAGSTTRSAIVGANQPPGEKRYFCVEIPSGVTSITFELTGLTADLQLIVGHPDLATVQQGGLWFWMSNEPGTAGETIAVEPASADSVRAGPYYIEVSAQGFEGSSPFDLSVRTS